MKIVLDTNVLVSGLLSPFGAPAEIVRMAASGVVSLCFDSRILTEYKQVLERPVFQFHLEDIRLLLDQIEADGFLVESKSLPERLPDETDQPFLEAALSTDVDFLITGNIKHFPPNKRHGAKVLTPVEFMDSYRKKQKY